ncbi:MAG TPA: carboxypeptidase regulatory-like domain-containing protein, partial [Thermoplasmatales archaeon]|nr:carboxypeptidase regulatory-like domain-containing protein [Thermoplasmatales archaeon]
MRKIKSLFVVVLMLVSMASVFKIGNALDQPFPVYGYIKDSQGNPVSGATVIVRDVSKSTQISVTTLGNGYYQADLFNLPNCENGDTIKVSCSYNNEENSKSFVLNIQQTSKNISFSLIGDPSVSTLNAYNITSYTAILKGELTDLGGDNSCQVWFQYGTTPSYGFTTTKTTLNSPGVFTKSISNLKPDKTYHFRAVAKNSKGTVYGVDAILTTPPAMPQVTTYSATNIGYESAKLNGYLSKVGASSCEVWFVYDVSYHNNWWEYAYETPHFQKTTASSFSHTITGLSLNVTYHFRAVASNPAGNVSGNDKTFTTHVLLPGISTLNAYNITSYTAILKGELTDLGGSESCQVWFEYGETSSYGLSTNIISINTTGEFSIFIENLNPGKIYHFRAVAKNSKGISYGIDKTFSTLAVKASVETNSVDYAIVLKGNLTSLGGDASCQVWFEYWEENGTHVSTSKQTVSKTGLFTETITGLNENSTYYYRAIVENSKGISYGVNLSFKMYSLPSPPEIETLNASAGSTNATLYANLTNMGDSVFCYVWFEYWNKTKTKYTTPINITNTTGIFHVEVKEIEDGKKYFYRAVAVGSNGRISYGDVKNFTTIAMENHNPNITILYPENGSVTGVNISMQVNIYDADNDTVNVTFYWENNTRIKSVNTKNGIASVAVNLDYGKSYGWYVVADDGKNESKSQIIYF